ncbi:putative sensor domain DACNV-containing protein [Pedobacter sp. Du54]|uniref:putative sensor domain DACNV-containing protein n=1 Tax=Pedobacter anseongensis TaxID=3133439 RepID=UPI003098A5F9
MVNRATYQAAKLVASKVEAHFAKHLAEANAKGEVDLAPQPPARVIEAILDAAFWSSLRKEEGHSPKISIAFLPPEQAGKPMIFNQRLKLNPDVLTKLAPGVEGAGIHIGVWHDGYNLHIWGTTLNIPNYCFVVDVSEPGLLVIKHRRIYGFGKYTNVAVLKGDQIKIVEEKSAGNPDCPPMLLSLLDLTAHSYWNDSANILIQLAVSMRGHGRGGAVLLVPHQSETWKQSIIQPISYALEPEYKGLADLASKNRPDASEIFWQSALKREVDHLAGLTAIDGATIINDKYELLAFGTKTGRANSSAHIQEISFSEPISGGDPIVVHPAKIGGTRHLSAAQFVYDQPDAQALVASQDGHFTIYNWSPSLEMVQAHRIDTLLL